MKREELFEKGDRLCREGKRSEGLSLIGQAAELGHPRAMEVLGEEALHGHDGAPDYEKSYAWSKKAAEAGQVRALTNLGILSMYGQGCEKDVSRALEYLMEASDKGDFKAPRYIGIIWEEGLNGQKDEKRLLSGIGRQRTQAILPVSTGWLCCTRKAAAWKKIWIRPFSGIKRALPAVILSRSLPGRHWKDWEFNHSLQRICRKRNGEMIQAEKCRKGKQL